jgi:hypothetical protein
VPTRRIKCAPAARETASPKCTHAPNSGHGHRAPEHLWLLRTQANLGGPSRFTHFNFKVFRGQAIIDRGHANASFTLSIAGCLRFFTLTQSGFAGRDRDDRRAWRPDPQAPCCRQPFAVMIHDVRWLLIFAWPFATFAVWEFARAFSKRRAIIQGWTVTAALLAAFLLGWLYWALAPTDTRSLDQAIQLICDWVQVPARTAEKVHEIQLIAGKGGVPTVQPYLDIKESPTYTYRCRFTNLS